MTQITLNIPDNEIEFFLKFARKYNYSISETDFELSLEQMAILDKSTATPIEDCISAEDLKVSLKNKHAL